ncbi:hypothetical protein BAUCODRAFT_22919 [Baudoinia panamericana UAMH 10762]|uniref:NADH-ubiquinone oxidoreductase subunit B14.7 n=1 Tax=Baudoinia panamericana (strain UAMH 10762) TaxID=717646 RepID=M2LU63_BAUPA|nr:uncharacterized protein BAUCODRAFT_22919 [Baudoinia panamericana UAMH 10762]EMC98082.1 hypothetical protein BAUCODRAFT_22919 [Baudoinia panamericana UAMH 10762]
MADVQQVNASNGTAVDVLAPSLRVGAICGCAGFLIGGTSGILKGTTPFLFATASAIQTFALGTTYWTCRSAFLQSRFAIGQSPRDCTKASTVAGGVSGGIIGLVTRGRRNLLPGMLVWSLLGCTGQLAYNRFSTADQKQPTEGFWTRLAKQSWTPVKFMTNEEYAEVLRERVLKLDAEIAVLDDKISELKSEEATASGSDTAASSGP